jgi:repressor LexA
MTTSQQRKLYEFIDQYPAAQGYLPTFEEIAKGIGFNPRSVSLMSRRVQVLAKSGGLTAQKKGSRQSVCPSKPRNFPFPLLGRSAAGSPIEAIADNHQLVNLGVLFKDDNRFMLKIKGGSMVEEKIFDGDFMICKRSDRAEEGDSVAALIDQQDATLKRLSYQLKGMVTLISANANLKTKTYPPHRIQIQGVLVATMRFKK